MNEFKPYKAGDVVLFWDGQIEILSKLQKLVNEPVAHAGIFYDYIKEDGSDRLKMRVLEATMTGLDLLIYDLDDPNLIIMRYREPIDEIAMRQTIWKYYSKLYQMGKHGYSYRGLLDAGINVALKYLTLGVWRKKRVLKDDIKPFCSEAVIEILETYFGKKLVRDNNIVSPSDIYRDKNFTIIKDVPLKSKEFRTLFEYIAEFVITGKITF